MCSHRTRSADIGFSGGGAFESVGAILVVTMLIVPAATSYLVTVRLLPMVVVTVLVGWVAAVGGYGSAVALDASIGGAMGMVAAFCFLLALLFAPRYGFLTRALVRARRRNQARPEPKLPVAAGD